MYVSMGVCAHIMCIYEGALHLHVCPHCYSIYNNYQYSKILLKQLYIHTLQHMQYTKGKHHKTTKQNRFVEVLSSEIQFQLVHILTCYNHSATYLVSTWVSIHSWLVHTPGQYTLPISTHFQLVHTPG